MSSGKIDDVELSPEVSHFFFRYTNYPIFLYQNLIYWYIYCCIWIQCFQRLLYES